MPHSWIVGAGLAKLGDLETGSGRLPPSLVPSPSCFFLVASYCPALGSKDIPWECQELSRGATPLQLLAHSPEKSPLFEELAEVSREGLQGCSSAQFPTTGRTGVATGPHAFPRPVSPRSWKGARKRGKGNCRLCLYCSLSQHNFYWWNCSITRNGHLYVATEHGKILAEIIKIWPN